MDEFYKEILKTAGAYGMMLIGLVWFSKFLFTEQVRRSAELDKKHETLEIEFREYLKNMVKEQHEIIEANTNAYNKFMSMIETYLTKSK